MNELPLDTSFPYIIYILYNSSIGLYNIGKTSDLERKFKSLQNASGCLLEMTYVLCLEEDVSSLEKDLYNYFSDKRKVGEWFDISLEDIEEGLTFLELPPLKNGYKKDL